MHCSKVIWILKLYKRGILHEIIIHVDRWFNFNFCWNQTFFYFLFLRIKHYLKTALEVLSYSWRLNSISLPFIYYGTTVWIAVLLGLWKWRTRRPVILVHYLGKKNESQFLTLKIGLLRNWWIWVFHLINYELLPRSIRYIYIRTVFFLTY